MLGGHNAVKLRSEMTLMMIVGFERNGCLFIRSIVIGLFNYRWFIKWKDKSEIN